MHFIPHVWRQFCAMFERFAWPLSVKVGMTDQQVKCMHFRTYQLSGWGNDQCSYPIHSGPPCPMELFQNLQEYRHFSVCSSNVFKFVLQEQGKPVSCPILFWRHPAHPCPINRQKVIQMLKYQCQTSQGPEMHACSPRARVQGRRFGFSWAQRIHWP